LADFIQKSVQEHGRLAPDDALKQLRKPVVFVLENIRSGNNVGSILRTADGFVLQEVIMSGYTPCPPHREILKTSLGAEASVPWRHVSDLAACLSSFRQNNYRITALEQTSNSTMLDDYVTSEYAGTVVILGNEVRGVSADALALVDEVIEIPQGGTKQSFNVSVAAGVVAWALTR
jgi:tRNA G18 (ribose-2'-O)-methylase SpoU